MKQSIVIETSIDELKAMFSQLIEEKLNSKKLDAKISAKKIMDDIGIKDLRVFKNACKRNGVKIYGLGKQLCINETDVDQLIKEVG